VSIKNNIVFTETLYSSSVTLVRRGVYKNGKPVVVKYTAQDVPDERLIEQYKISYLSQKKVSHPAVSKAVELIMDGTGCALVMEDIAGESLGSWINTVFVEHSRWPLEIPGLFHLYLLRLLRWSIMLAEGIAAFHQQDIIHNDINPANIAINSETDQLQVIDFGASFPDGSNINDWSVVDQHRTLTYISPEQTGRLNRNIDYRSDYYALGATLYQLFSGRPPFIAKDLPELIHCHIARHPVPLDVVNPLLPASLSALILKLMAKAPEDRYQNGRCLIQDLKAIEQAVKTGMPLSPALLGNNDVPEKLLIPTKLYGRERELKSLQKVLNETNSKHALITVEGEAGGGKTSLVNEAILHFIDRPIQVLSGKSETYNKRPHLALSQALSQSVELLLALPDKIYLPWRKALLNELNQNPHTLIGLCPDLCRVFDGVDVADKGLLHNADIQLKLHTAIYLRHLSKLEPILLVIDDVQWCDAPSFSLLEALIRDNHPRITLLFTCRSDEVDESHLYSRLKRSIDYEGISVTEISLKNLSIYNICELLSATFHGVSESYIDISKILFGKTLGNPLFINEFLKAAHKKNDEALFYDNSKGRWCWNEEKLVQVATAGNVAALLVDSLHQQSSETQDVLQWAACIGTKFSGGLLSFVTGFPADRIKACLNPAYQQGYIHKSSILPNHYIFNHDRIRQAYYELLSGKDAIDRHWVIGLACLNFSEKYSDDPLPHLLGALQDKQYLNSSCDFDLDVIVLKFFNGAQLAKEKMAYEIGLQYINCAFELLENAKYLIDTGGIDRDVYYDKMGDILLLQGSLGYLSNNRDLAEKSYMEYRHIHDDPVRKASSYAQQIPLVFVLGDFDVMVSYSLKCFSLLGVDVPGFGEDILPQIDEQWSEFRKLGGFSKIEGAGNPKEIDSIELSTLHSTAANMMLLGLNVSKFQWAEWFGLVGINSYLSRGYTKFVPQLMGIFDSMLYSIGKFNTNCTVADKASEFIKIDQGFPGDGFVYNTIGAYGGRYSRSMIECVEYLDVGAKRSFEKGEYLPYLACISNKMTTSFSAGHSLAKLQEHAEDLRRFLISCGEFVSVGKIYYRLLNQLVNVEEVDLLDRKRFSKPQWEALKNSVAYGAYFHLKLQLAFWRGEYAYVSAEYTKKRSLLETVHGFSIGDDNHFLNAISLFNNALIDDPFSINSAFEYANESVQYICRVGAIYPPNFRHKVLLIEAEQQRLKGDPRASDTYQSAAIDAKENGFIQMYALAHELHASYWQQQGRPDYVKHHIEKAFQGYHRWGCALKIDQLQRRFGQYLLQQTPAEFQDQRKLLKISNQIAEELDLNKRLNQIIELAVEHTGAEHGILLLKHNEKYIAHPGAHLNDKESQGHQAVIDPLPMVLINSCVLSRQPLLVGDAANDPRCKDFVISLAQNVLSLLCYPVVHKGECQSLLLLTHSQLNAFTEQSRQLLQSLAPQIAVSIENAQLYHEHQGFKVVLEQKVAQSTYELRAVNEALQAFTASVSHDLRAPLRAIVGFTGALAEDFSLCLGEKGALDAAQLFEESDSMREIIEGLIVLSRSTQSGLRREEVNLSTLVEDKLRWLRTMEVEHEVGDSVQQGLTANGDLRLLKQVVDNLIINAWKFSHEVEAPAISFGMLATGKSQHTFYVQDNGVGFDAANADELFSPFRRFHKGDAFEGSGIGLATVYRIIKRHGGEVWVESEVNQGAIFYFTLSNTAT